MNDLEKAHRLSQGLEEKGDKYFKKEKFKAALKYYRKAKDLNPDNSSIYDKLLASHNELKNEWSDEDFTESLSWTMKKQELENPKIKRIHAQLEPEWMKINQLIQELMMAESDEKETILVESIAGYGIKAVYPLVEVIIKLKQVRQKINP